MGADDDPVTPDEPGQVVGAVGDGEGAAPAPEPPVWVASGTSVAAVGWSPDGTRLASGDDSGRVRVWDPVSGVAVAALDGHLDPGTVLTPLRPSPVTSVAWSPDGTRLASGDTDGRVRVWDPATGVVTEHRKHWVTSSVVWSPDGSRIASASGPDPDDGNLSKGDVRVWDSVTGVDVAEIPGLYTVRNSGVQSVGWSPDGSRVAVAGGGKSSSDVRVRDPVSGVFVAVLPNPGLVWAVGWSPDGTRLAVASTDPAVLIWEPATARVVAVLEGHTHFVHRVAWSPDGTRLASASYDGTVRVWDPVFPSAGPSPSPAKRRRWWSGRTKPSPPVSVMATHSFDISANAIDWAGGLLAVATSSGEVRLLDPSDSAVAGLTMLHLDDGGWASFHPSGAYRLAGDPAGQFWWVVGDEHIEPGDADGINGIRRLPIDAPWPDDAPG